MASTPTSKQKTDELSRIGNLKRQYDVAALIFAVNAGDGTFELQNAKLDFLASGRDEALSAKAGFTASVGNKGPDLTTLEKNGYPSKRFNFVVTGLAIGPASLPYTPHSNTGSGTSTTVHPYGIQALDAQDVAEQLWRNSIRGARLFFVQKNGCERELGLVSEYPPGEGIDGSKVMGSVGVPEARVRELFRRDAIILPRSIEDNADEAVFRVVFAEDSVSDDENGIPTPLDPKYATATGVRAMHIKLSLEGFYSDEEGNPIDETETQIRDQSMAQAA